MMNNNPVLTSIYRVKNKTSGEIVDGEFKDKYTADHYVGCDKRFELAEYVFDAVELETKGETKIYKLGDYVEKK